MDELNINMESLKVDENVFKDIKYYTSGQLNDKVHDLLFMSVFYVLYDFMLIYRFWKYYAWAVQSK